MLPWLGIGSGSPGQFALNEQGPKLLDNSQDHPQAPQYQGKEKQGNLLLPEDDQNSTQVEHFSKILHQQTPDTVRLYLGKTPTTDEYLNK